MADFSNIQPLNDQVLLKMEPVKEIVSDGIIIQKGAIIDQSQEDGSLYSMRFGLEDSTEGTVIAVGGGKRDSKGRLEPMNVKVGDFVQIDKGSGNFLNEKEGIRLVRQDDILLVRE